MSLLYTQPGDGLGPHIYLNINIYIYIYIYGGGGGGVRVFLKKNI